MPSDRNLDEYDRITHVGGLLSDETLSDKINIRIAQEVSEKLGLKGIKAA